MASIRDPVLAAGLAAPYQPILPAAHAELTALHHLRPAEVPLLTPVLSLWAADTPRYFAERVAAYLPAGLHIGVDLDALPDPRPGEQHPARLLAEELADRDIAAYPVIRLTDSTARLAHHGAAAELHLGRAAVRLHPFGARPGALGARLDEVWRTTRLDPERCDLLLDLGAIEPRGHLDPLTERVRRVLDWAGKTPWRMVTVAAGAMPPLLPFLPAGVTSRIPRWDLLLWRRFAHLGVGYGDYAVTAPRGGQPDERPLLRYADDDEWLIYRWPRYRPPEPAWVPAADPDHCWGDAEVARRARLSHQAGSDWHAWGTSHHLTRVLTEVRQVDRL